MFLTKILRFGILCLFFLVLKSRCIQANVCSDSVYMRIQYTKKFLNSSVNQISPVNDGYQCLEHCKNHATCKSVGIETRSMTCYLYADRVYAGLPGIDNSSMIYYWLLEAECPVHLGYTEDPSSGVCYKYNYTTVPWLDAQRLCEEDGGYLFQIDTGAKETITNSIQLAFVVALGGTDIGEQGTWNWFNGVPVVNFRNGDPSNTGGIEHCLGWYSNGIADNNCDYAGSYMCEVPTIKTHTNYNGF